MMIHIDKSLISVETRVDRSRDLVETLPFALPHSTIPQYGPCLFIQTTTSLMLMQIQRRVNVQK